MIKVALLGFGGIAQAHKKAYANLEKIGLAKLVCACDIDENRFVTSTKINIDNGENQQNSMNFNCYTDIEEMLSKENIDMVDVCLPTFLHKDMTVMLLNRGYHVMCEKPMAKTYKECTEMIEAAKENNRYLMIGQCLHFSPPYVFLKELVDTKKFGKPLSALFERISSSPTWGWNNWFMDSDKSGGCLQDMHIHDVDFAKYLFGTPYYVYCDSRDGYGKWDDVHTLLKFKDMNSVAICGDWSQRDYPFTEFYRVNFEKATVVFEHSKVTVYPFGGESYIEDIPQYDSYEKEIEYFCKLIIENKQNIINKPEDAALSVKLIEALRESSEINKPLDFNE